MQRSQSADESLSPPIVTKQDKPPLPRRGSLKRWTTMVSFADDTVFGGGTMPTPTAEDDAKIFLKELKSTMPTSGITDYIRMHSYQSAGESLSPPMGTKQDDCEPPLARSGSVKRCTTTRQVVDERDSHTLLTPAFCPWEENDAQKRCVKRLDDQIMSTWGIMYCGGSKAVISDLREISNNYDIDLHIDSFSW